MTDMAFDITKLIGETTDYDKKQELEIRRPKSWCKSVSAFANGNGGRLIFGIADDDTVVGVDNPQKTGEKFSEIVKQKMDPIPPFRFDYEEVDGKTIMIVTIAPGDQTPYYYIGDGQHIAYYRMGNESIPVSAIKLRELVLKGTNRSFDSLSTDHKFENYDFSRLRSVFHSRTGKEFTENDYESWGIVDRNGKLTNAGALIANESPIRHSRLFCTRWNGLDQSHGLMDALDDAEISGSLIDLLLEGLAFVRRNSHKMWHKSPDGRVELPDYPEDSILEGLVNALIHRSYLEIGSEVHLDMFDNRIEIFSPGGMYENKPVQECDIMDIKSRRRNPILADIFSRLKYMERRGSGFKKICNEYSHQVNYREELKPAFRSNDSDFVITFYNLNYGISGEEKELVGTTDNNDNGGNVVNSVVNGGKNGSNDGGNGSNLVPQSSPLVPQSSPLVPHSLQNFIKVLKNFPGGTIALLAGELNVSERMVKKYIKELKALGLIRRIGNNRNGFWEFVTQKSEEKEI